MSLTDEPHGGTGRICHISVILIIDRYFRRVHLAKYCRFAQFAAYRVAVFGRPQSIGRCASLCTFLS